jgi:hypothetical protein
VGLILDLAVAALALVVIGSLATLAWTLAVSAVRATRHGRERVAAMRRSAADVEARLPASMARADARLVQALGRTGRPDNATAERHEKRETRETT